MAIKQLDMIRTTVPLEGPDVFDDTRIHHLPVGTEGTVIEVWLGGEAYEVEFAVGDLEGNFRSVMIPVDKNAVEEIR